MITSLYQEWHLVAWSVFPSAKADVWK